MRRPLRCPVLHIRRQERAQRREERSGTNAQQEWRERWRDEREMEGWGEMEGDEVEMMRRWRER